MIKAKRILVGTVVSDAMDKTVAVRVTRRYKHPLYKKVVTARKKYLAHDEENAFHEGDIVRIQECAPISKRKTWFVKEKIGESRR
ncbi:30S ribosomal protein S17 [bacterium]|jgi:small subunit ribosomal protein S17|nr:30S ribosomal protein S17 [bacterium]